MQSAGLDRNDTVNSIYDACLPVGRITDLAEMAALYEAGQTTKQIADYYGVKPPAVTRALNKVGIKPRRFGPVRDDALAELVSTGLSVTAAAGALGISQQRASQLWQRIVDQLGWQAQ